MRCLALLAIVIALSGCATPPIDGDKPEQPTATSLPAATSWQFSDCFGFSSSTEFPLGLGPGAAPPGWQFSISDGRFLTQVVIETLQCNRVSVGNFEGGPVSLVFELHSNFTAPDDCEAGSYSSLRVVHQVLTNRERLAEQLRVFGMNANFAEIAVSGTNSTPLVHNWVWTDTRAADSTFTVRSIDNSTRPATPSVDRLVWWNATTLSIAEASAQSDIPNLTVAFGSGTWGAGMLIAHSGNNYYNFVNVYRDTDVTTTLQTYGDFQCAKASS